MYYDDDTDLNFDPYEKVELGQKERIIEFLAVGMSFGLLAACFLKVMFF